MLTIYVIKKMHIEPSDNIPKVNLIKKYNVPCPRYTSYPTVPYWEELKFNETIWKKSLIRSFNESNLNDGISLYIHLPFCESLCTFCGCNKRITKNHQVEKPYMESILKEWELYCDLLPERPVIREIHLGGGTPTFFSADNLAFLIDNLFQKAEKHPLAEFSLEGHPNNTSREQLQRLYDLGFRRISYGIQDFDPKVQMIINRVQSYEAVKEVTELAREIGFSSINYDIIYGLPLQTRYSIIDTINKVSTLQPDRIAYYSYAHVPWIKGNGQRQFSEADLPVDVEKREMYELGRRMLEGIGYREIGMDHFALTSDQLYQAFLNKTLHRNFMGYTASSTRLMIGLGVSSISDSWYAFAQNVKSVEEYMEQVKNGKLPLLKGHNLNKEDLVLRKQILNIMCNLKTTWYGSLYELFVIDKILPRLQEFSDDGLINLENCTLTVTEKGKPFIRNICMAFDTRLWRNKPGTQLFSMTI